MHNLFYLLLLVKMNRETLLWLILFFFGLLSYMKAFEYNSKKNGFHMDDVVAIEKNLDVVDIVFSWYEFLRHDFWGLPMFTGEWTHKSFRPLTTLTYRINRILAGGVDTNWFHITNIIMHNLVVILIFFFSKKDLKMTIIQSLISASLFAVHPVHTESVLYLVGRADILSGIFFLLALIFFEKKTFSILLGILAGLSKELGFMVFPIFVFMDLVKGKSCWKNVCTTILVLGTRVWYTDGTYLRMSPQDNPFAFEPDFLGRFLSFSLVHAEYFRLLVFPKFLCYDYSLNTIPLVCHWGDVRLLGVFGTYAFFFGLAKTSLSSENSMLLLAFFVATIVPSLNIFFHVGTVVGERLMYLPSIPVVIVFASGTTRLSRFFCVVVFACWLGRTLARVEDWKSAANLTRVDGNLNPNSAKTMYNLAVQHFTAKEYDLAYTSFVASFESDVERRDGIAHWRAGQVEILRGNLLNAESLLVAATTKYGAKLMVREEEIFHDAGLAIYHNGNTELARMYLESALRLNRRFPKALNNLGCLLANHGQPTEGLTLIQEAASLKSRNVIYWGNVWIVASSLGIDSVWRIAKSSVHSIQPSFVPNSKCVWEFKPAEGGPGNTAESD